MATRPPLQQSSAFNSDMHNTPRASYVSLATTTEINRDPEYPEEPYRSPLSSSLFRDDFRTPRLDYTLSWDTSAPSTREDYFNPVVTPPANAYEPPENAYDIGSPFPRDTYEQDAPTPRGLVTSPSVTPGTLYPPLSKEKAAPTTNAVSSKSSKRAKRRLPAISRTALVIGAVLLTLVVEEVVIGALWIFLFSLRSPALFVQAYFGTKIHNLIAAVLVAMVGLALQAKFFKQLTQDQLTLQLWSFLLIFTTYLAASIAAAVIKKITQQTTT